MNMKSLLVLALTLFTLGCGNTSVNDKNEKRLTEQSSKMKVSHIIGRTTEYYVGNPAQARATDGLLKAGISINVIEDAGSYTLVETKEGIRGYISSDAIEVINPK